MFPKVLDPTIVQVESRSEQQETQVKKLIESVLGELSQQEESKENQEPYV